MARHDPDSILSRGQRALQRQYELIAKLQAAGQPTDHAVELLERMIERQQLIIAAQDARRDFSS